MYFSKLFLIRYVGNRVLICNDIIEGLLSSKIFRIRKFITLWNSQSIFIVKMRSNSILLKTLFDKRFLWRKFYKLGSFFNKDSSLAQFYFRLCDKTVKKKHFALESKIQTHLHKALLNMCTNPSNVILNCFVFAKRYS